LEDKKKLYEELKKLAGSLAKDYQNYCLTMMVIMPDQNEHFVEVKNSLKRSKLGRFFEQGFEETFSSEPFEKLKGEGSGVPVHSFENNFL